MLLALLAADAQAAPIETDVVTFVHGLTGLGQFAVDGDSTCDDPGLDLPARADATGSEALLDSLAHP